MTRLKTRLFAAALATLGSALALASFAQSLALPTHFV